MKTLKKLYLRLRIAMLQSDIASWDNLIPFSEYEYSVIKEEQQARWLTMTAYEIELSILESE